MMHDWIANPRWRGKRAWHSRRMRNPQFCVSGKRPIVQPIPALYLLLIQLILMITKHWCIRLYLQTWHKSVTKFTAMTLNRDTLIRLPAERIRGYDTYPIKKYMTKKGQSFLVKFKRYCTYSLLIVNVCSWFSTHIDLRTIVTSSKMFTDIFFDLLSPNYLI